MTVKDMKVQLLEQIQEVENEIIKLQDNIKVAKESLDSLDDEATNEELKVFFDDFDLEVGLEHIQLF
jgi:predicted  nucleic acid-binding Zn-ribbon protein